MIIKVHRTWVVKDVGPSFQGCAPDITELEQFETKEEAEAYKKKYEQKMKGKHWMDYYQCLYYRKYLASVPHYPLFYFPKWGDIYAVSAILPLL